MPSGPWEWSPRGEYKGVFEKGDLLLRRGGRYPRDVWEVLAVREGPGGGYTVRPRVGGGLHEVSRLYAVRNFRKLGKKDVRPAFYGAQFRLEFIGDETFEGYTDGDLWNGFATPNFEFEEARRVLEEITRAAEREGWDDFGLTWEYDPKEDAFVVTERQYPEPWFIRGRNLTVDGTKIRTYPVGAYSWTWHEVNE